LGVGARSKKRCNAAGIWTGSLASPVGLSHGTSSRAYRLFHNKNSGRNVDMPTWRVEYFDRTNGQSPERSIIIAAENEALAFEEVRARMAPTCSRAEVTKLGPESTEPS
jgi:hypothetical protein